MKNDSWLKIVDFPNYEINESTLAVRSNRGGRQRELKGWYNGGAKRVRLVNDDTTHDSYLSRLLYVAQHGISPLSIPVGMVVTTSKTGVLELVSREEQVKRLLKSNRNKYKSKEEAIAECHEAKNTLEGLIYYYKTGDMGNVVEQLYGYRVQLITYALRLRYACSQQAAGDLFDAALDAVLARIINGVVIAHLLPYMKKMVRSISRERRQQRVVEYNDARQYEEAIY